MRRFWREDALWILGPLCAAGLGVAGWYAYRWFTEQQLPHVYRVF